MALACVVAACGWTVYSNVFGADVYPTLGTDASDAVNAPAGPMATRQASQAIRDAFTILPEATSVFAKPKRVAALSPSEFNDRFSAAQPQGVASRAAEGAPPPAAAPKLAVAPKPDLPKLAEASKETSKTRPAAPMQIASLNVPPPSAQPPAEARPTRSGLSLGDMAQRAKQAVLSITSPNRSAITEKLWGKPQPSQGGTLLAYASADANVTGSLQDNGDKPRYERDTAVYDISAHVVYLPDGSKLEAHSGLGSKLDDPSSAPVRMHGVTPPHMYELSPRESLFHGVAALRLNPVGGEGAIYGRSGLLAHSFMLGPNGDSNGCVSFRDYNAFLDAYHNKGIRKLAVVTRID
ncbi:DUF2778 domain-containing protein [Bradyrhizobium sp.]|uniref:DUF2778 domain-containing protein n=1 Tax=Bradyrhizobium sp. TaxID=376 RepID=UPI00345DCA3F